MKKVLPFLLSSILTSSMALGYFYGIDAPIDFAVTFYWILIILTVLLSGLVSFLCAAIDEGVMEDENKIKVFNSLGKKRNPLTVTFNATLTLFNIALLVLSGYGVTACFYMISSGLAIWSRTAVIKRRVNDEVDNLHK